MNSEFTNLEFFYRLLALISLFLFGFSSPSWQDEPNPTLWLALRTETFSVTMCLYNSVSARLSPWPWKQRPNRTQRWKLKFPAIKRRNKLGVGFFQRTMGKQCFHPMSELKGLTLSSFVSQSRFILFDVSWIWPYSEGKLHISFAIFSNNLDTYNVISVISDVTWKQMYRIFFQVAVL